MKTRTQKAEQIRLVAQARMRYKFYRKTAWETYLTICKNDNRKPLTFASFIKCTKGDFYNEKVKQAFETLNREPSNK